jgi:hypothetical protein
MKVRVRNIIAVVMAIPVLVAGVLVYQDYDERRMIREEETLKKLDMGSFSVENATAEAALKLIVERIHVRGHPEVRLRMYSDAKQVPYFHRTLKPELSPLDGPANLTFTLGKDEPLPLRELLGYVSVLSRYTCEFRGHDLIVVPAVGTMERFRRRSYQVAPFGLADEKSALQWLKENGMEPRYEGMTIGFDEKKSLVFFGPASEDQLDHDLLHTTWKERLHFFLLEWKIRLFGY